jgi:hypothetical protein
MLQRFKTNKLRGIASSGIMLVQSLMKIPKFDKTLLKEGINTRI